MGVYVFLVLATLAAFFSYQLYRRFNIARNKNAEHEPIDKNTSLSNDLTVNNTSEKTQAEVVPLTPMKTATTEQAVTQDTNEDIQSDNDLLTTLKSDQVGEPANSSGYDIDTENMDIADMTIDVSEMLKELNLRESDSPRLEIDESQYNQLKTGEPGEVSPDTIEDVASKLRNMLH